MAKARSVFICDECGSDHPRWLGRCPDCNCWDSIREMRLGAGPSPAAAPFGTAKAIPIGDVEPSAEKRLPTGLAEVDRVLGGGFVPGCGILLAGEPGIGKSTLLLQIAQKMSGDNQRFLYVTGEESAAQVRLRADRIGISGDPLFILAECDLQAIEEQITSVAPAVVGIDSVQALRWAELPTGTGSVMQVREVTGRLLALAKRQGFPLILVGHVTKEGGVAGPKALEHMVDGVLQIEGERGRPLRLLRGLKNRYGSTEEVGIFEMRSDGLVEVDNPSNLLLGERRPTAPGSATAAVLEGSRPLLVEVQALVTPASHGPSARKVSGIDGARLSMLAAVFTKRLGLPLADCDIHANAVGGIRLRGTSGDLALAAALLSSFHDRRLPADCIFVGEVGLLGEVRPIAGLRQRLEEAHRLGFDAGCIPVGSLQQDAPAGMRIHEVSELAELARRFVE